MQMGIGREAQNPRGEGRGPRGAGVLGGEKYGRWSNCRDTLYLDNHYSRRQHYGVLTSHREDESLSPGLGVQEAGDWLRGNTLTPSQPTLPLLRIQETRVWNWSAVRLPGWPRAQPFQLSQPRVRGQRRLRGEESARRVTSPNNPRPWRLLPVARDNQHQHCKSLDHGIDFSYTCPSLVLCQFNQNTKTTRLPTLFLRQSDPKTSHSTS